MADPNADASTNPRAPVAQAKRDLRLRIARRLAGLTPARREAAATALTERLASLAVVRDAATIMAFLSLPAEIDTWPFIRWAWREGKRIAVPRVEAAPAGPAGRSPMPRMVPTLLDAVEVGTPAEHPAVRPGTMGILEVFVVEPLPVAEIDVVLVPCQAVEPGGYRLGKGGGFYDRFLSDPALHAASVLAAFEEQVVDRVPLEPWDRPVEAIVTDGRTCLLGDLD